MHDRRAILIALALALSCEKYDGPPEPSLPEATGGLLADPAAPLVVQFSKPIDPSSLRLEVARDLTDDRGLLADEADAGPLQTLFTTAWDAPSAQRTDTGGTTSLSDDRTTLRIAHPAAFPLAPKLVLVVEPGLADDQGARTTVRRKIPFGFSVDVQCSKPTKVFPPLATYFMIVDVQQPVGVQVRLFAKLKVDQATGKFTGAFIRAGRIPDPNRCSPPCKTTEACRTLPGPPACVVPSERATSPDEFPDFYPDSTSMASYQFVTLGCVIDQPDGTAQFVNLPVDIASPSPPVVLSATKLTSTFSQGKDGVLRGAGTLTAERVLLFGSDSGKGTGELVARMIPDAQAPQGVPDAP